MAFTFIIYSSHDQVIDMKFDREDVESDCSTKINIFWNPPIFRMGEA